MVFQIFSCVFEYLFTFVGHVSRAKLTLIHRVIVGLKNINAGKDGTPRCSDILCKITTEFALIRRLVYKGPATPRCINLKTPQSPVIYEFNLVPR